MRCVRPLGALLTLALLWGGSTAQAQFGGSLSLQSDQRFRGVSQSGERPQARLSLGYDGVGGWYGGALLGEMRFDERRRSALVLTYLGRVVPLGMALHGEAGAILTQFPGVTGYGYGELYVGLGGQRWGTRLYASPDYFGRGHTSLYAELELNGPLAPGWQLFGHLGALQGRKGMSQAVRLDLRAGLAWRLPACELQLALVASSRGGPYPTVYEQRRAAPVLGLSLPF